MTATRLRPAREPVCPWRLRIELLDVSPTVWRRLVVPSNIQLPMLHDVFQGSLGWTNSHLHQFLINGMCFAEPDPDGMDVAEMVDERRILLAEVLLGSSRTFEYVYDFGDHWQHAVILEDIYTAPVARVPVRCLAGENACPPEDVGGPSGYDDFRAAIADPQHEAHEDLLAWCGGGFDSAHFDLDAVNRELAKLKI